MATELKYTQVKMIEMGEWDRLVMKTYGRPYCLQQQNGCMGRGVLDLVVPDDDYDEDMPESIPEIVNGDEMGVKMASWLARDPKKFLEGREGDVSGLNLWWERNFYPDLNTIANDLYSRGLIEAGEYVINIDW